MEKHVRELDEEGRFDTWHSMVKVAVESILHDVVDERYYVCKEVLSTINLFDSVENIQAARDLYSHLLHQWMRPSGKSHDVPKPRAYAAMQLSAMQRRLAFQDYTNSKYNEAKRMHGGGYHVFILLMNNHLFGILDFSDGAIRAAREKLGGVVFLCNGGGGYVYVSERKTEFPELDKSKGVGANYSHSAALEAMLPTFHGEEGHAWEPVGEIVGLTDTAI
eukprot:880899-Rhodomonas_salina.1